MSHEPLCVPEVTDAFQIADVSEPFCCLEQWDEQAITQGVIATPCKNNMGD